MTPPPFEYFLRAFIEDTDAGGLVYHANYLKFLERARSEWLRHLGYQQETLRQEDTLFVVRSLQIDYLKPAHLDDDLCVSVQVEKMGKASILMVQNVYRVNVTEPELLAVSQVKLACINTQAMPKAMPLAISQRIQQECQ